MSESTRTLEPGKPAVAVETTDNRKLGPVSATYASQASCPRSCPWFGAGCYAEAGHVAHTTRRLNRSDVRSPVAVARTEARAIDGLTGDRLLRLHVVGDCRTNAAARVLGDACRRYARRGNRPATGKKVWTYSHSWRTVARSSWGDAVSVLASVETVRDARAAMQAGYAAAVVVVAFEREEAYPVDGVTVVPCPEQTRGVTCRECGLCRDDERLRSAGIVIGFQAHGTGGPAIRRRLTALPMA
jgi:hypothetical protein